MDRRHKIENLREKSSASGIPLKKVKGKTVALDTPKLQNGDKDKNISKMTSTKDTKNGKLTVRSAIPVSLNYMANQKLTKLIYDTRTKRFDSNDGMRHPKLSAMLYSGGLLKKRRSGKIQKAKSKQIMKSNSDFHAEKRTQTPPPQSNKSENIYQQQKKRTKFLLNIEDNMDSRQQMMNDNILKMKAENRHPITVVDQTGTVQCDYIKSCNLNKLHIKSKNGLQLANFKNYQKIINDAQHCQCNQLDKVLEINDNNEPSVREMESNEYEIVKRFYQINSENKLIDNDSALDLNKIERLLQITNEDDSKLNSKRSDINLKMSEKAESIYDYLYTILYNDFIKRVESLVRDNADDNRTLNGSGNGKLSEIRKHTFSTSQTNVTSSSSARKLNINYPKSDVDIRKLSTTDSEFINLPRVQFHKMLKRIADELIEQCDKASQSRNSSSPQTKTSVTEEDLEKIINVEERLSTRQQIEEDTSRIHVPDDLQADNYTQYRSMLTKTRSSTKKMWIVVIVVLCLMLIATIYFCSYGYNAWKGKYFWDPNEYGKFEKDEYNLMRQESDVWTKYL